jgi:O-6-methylguanine DNA methyltransferase
MLVATPSVRPVLSRASETHAFALIPTSWGLCGAAWKNHEHESHAGFAERPSGSLLCKLLPPGLSPAAMRGELMMGRDCCEVLGDRHGNFHPEVVPEWFPELVRFLQCYYAPRSGGVTGTAQNLDNWSFWKPRLDWSRVTPFQRHVLQVVGEIPYGITKTYGQIAARVGKPSASRAVGAAVGANPWPVLLPCHRVMGAGGKLTGFSAPGGVETKQKMLALEKPGGFGW